MHFILAGWTKPSQGAREGVKKENSPSGLVDSERRRSLAADYLRPALTSDRSPKPVTLGLNPQTPDTLWHSQTQSRAELTH